MNLQDWEVGLSEIYFPFCGLKDLAEKTYNNGKRLLENANSTFEAAEELVRDAEYIEQATAEEKKEVKKLRKKAKQDLEMCKMLKTEHDEAKKILKEDQRLLDLLKKDFRETQGRAANDLADDRDELERKRKLLEEQQRRFREDQESHAKSVQEEANRLTVKQKEIDERELAFQTSREETGQALKQLTKTIENMDVSVTQRENALNARESDLNARTGEVERKEADIQREIPPSAAAMNYMLEPFARASHSFPVKTYNNVEELIHTVLATIPSIYKTLLAEQLASAATEALSKYPARGANTMFKWCGYYTGMVNKVIDETGDICFPQKTFSTAQELVDDLIKGCYLMATVRKVAQNIIDVCELNYFYRVEIQLSPTLIVRLPAKFYEGIESVHDQIMKQLHTDADVALYSQIVQEAINADTTLPKVSQLNPTTQGLVFTIKLGRTQVIVPVIPFKTLEEFLAQLRAGTSDQSLLTFTFKKWKILFRTPQRVRVKRQDEAVSVHSKQSSTVVRICSSIVGPQVYGDTTEKILRITPYPYENSNIVFNPIYYIPLLSDWISSIRVWLSLSNSSSFTEDTICGECIVLLHFRLKSNE